MISIGSRPRGAPSGFVGMLADCHTRIRRFAALAQRLADERDASPEAIRDAAHRVQRYFGEALPLHVADEDETVVPRLLGREPELDASLHRMSDEHRGHGDPLAELLELCGRLTREPASHAEVRDRLRAVTAVLVPAFTDHLAHEEEVIFPALASLFAGEPGVEAEMLDELRARRRVAFARSCPTGS
jgi:iron-sulfur cluster repair protein YtfE (RIC family)